MPAHASSKSAARRAHRHRDRLGRPGYCGWSGLAADRCRPARRLPAQVPPGTTLVIGDPQTQRALVLSGEIDKLPFKIEWANISGGARAIEAFRANALDVSNT